MAEVHFETNLNATRNEIDPINDGLYEYNASKLAADIPREYFRFTVSVKDDAGKVVGGVVAEGYWDWLHVETLWLSEAYRGQDIGTRLLIEAEDIARDKGLHHAQLETTSFQALGFYQKHGYTIFGTLDNKPPGVTWYYLRKDLYQLVK